MRSFNRGLPSSAISALTLATAASVIMTGAADSSTASDMSVPRNRGLAKRGGSGDGVYTANARMSSCRLVSPGHRLADGVALDFALRAAVLVAVIGDGRLDGVFGQDGAMDLHGRQRELFGNHGVLDRQCLVQRLALEPLGDERRRCDRRSAAIGLEFRVFDH